MKTERDRWRRKRERVKEIESNYREIEKDMNKKA